MLSARVPRDDLVALEVNMFWDGVFHAFTWSMVATGIVSLWRARREEARGIVLFGAMLRGFGLFNFVEGVIDHYVLELHHVVEAAGRSVWDGVFVASGLVLMLSGGALIRRGRVATT